MPLSGAVGVPLTLSSLAEAIYRPSSMKFRMQLSVRRACALQERILAPRTLFVDRDQLYLGVQYEVCCEIYPGELPPQFRDVPSVDLGTEALSSVWDQIFSLYSGAGLTFSEDKLVAISGVARLVQNETGGEYLAGMWRRNLEQQLCWNAKDQASQKPSRYRASSWSWASVDYTVELSGMMRHLSQHLLAYVYDAYVIPAGEDTFGQACAGVLRLGIQHLILGLNPRVTGTEVGRRCIRCYLDWDTKEDVDVSCHPLPVRS